MTPLCSYGAALRVGYRDRPQDWVLLGRVACYTRCHVQIPASCAVKLNPGPVWECGAPPVSHPPAPKTGLMHDQSYRGVKNFYTNVWLEVAGT